MTLVNFRKPADQAVFNSGLNLIENFFRESLLTKEHASFVPAVNISEEENKFNVELSAPGFVKSDFKVELNKNVLTVSAEHKTEKEAKETVKEKTFTRKEFNYGSFQRSFTLPEGINAEAIDAKYENGILNIVLPKKEKEKQNDSRAITIS